MEISVARLTKVFRTYQGQARMAELNKKNNLRTVQGQVDSVQISDEGRKKLESMHSGRKGATSNRIA
jgi:hypothetical protein